MSAAQSDKQVKSVVWLTADYSPQSERWYVFTSIHPPIRRALFKDFIRIEGSEIIYMVSGFDNYEDSKGFAVTYWKAQRDGLVVRVRLD